jgi:uncharacterized membrane protein YhaH (DUF805 family)
MRCAPCQKNVPPDAAYCPHCGAIFERHRIHHSPIDYRAYFFSPRYLHFLFFSVKGRLNRERYITGLFFLMTCFLIYFVGCILFGVYWGRHIHSIPQGFSALWISALIGAAVGYLLSIPLKIKRAHDLNHSAWLYWIWLIPGLSLFTALWLIVKNGTRGVNRHGLCPRGKNEEHRKEPLH